MEILHQCRLPQRGGGSLYVMTLNVPQHGSDICAVATIPQRGGMANGFS